jgi:serine/threonine protein phosphatase 1
MTGPTERGVLPDGERVYAIGDIHGHRVLLDAMLTKIASHAAVAPKARKTLIFLGDYVDRGPDTKGVLDRLTSPMHFVDRTVFLRGNHEQVLLDFLDDPGTGWHWNTLGGVETLASYGIDAADLRGVAGVRAAYRAFDVALPAAHRNFLERTQFHFAAGGYVFVHAGLRPGVPLSRQSEDDMIWIRGEFLNSSADFGAVVVHGHMPRPAAEILPNRINIDTGAFATGRLTCAILEGPRLSLLDTLSAHERVIR